MTASVLKVKPCPAEGDGVHKWVFYAACCAVEAGLTDEQAAEEIEFLMTRGPNPASEIEDALASARGERRSSSPRWSPANPVAIAEIAKNGPMLHELIARSPESIQFGEPTRSEEIIDALFPGDLWVCVGKSDHLFYTSRRRVAATRWPEKETVVDASQGVQLSTMKILAA